MRQWIPESSGNHTPESMAAGSDFAASWRCDRGCELCGRRHEWVAQVYKHAQAGTGCPFCSGHKICRCCSLAAKHPDLMKEWDWEDDQGIDAYSVGCHSHRKVSWICAEHGRWDASPSMRVNRGHGCPECGRRRLCDPQRQLGYVKHEFPDVYAELHPTKNSGIDTEKLTCGSHRKVWWLCQSDQRRPKCKTAAGDGVLQDVHSAAGVLSAHATLLQRYTQP